MPFVRWAVSQVQLFCFFFPGHGLFNWSITQKKTSIELVCEIEVPPLLVRYVGENRRTLGTGYGLKWGAIGNIVGELEELPEEPPWKPENIIENRWEQTGNMMQIQEFKNSIPTPHCLLFWEVALLDWIHTNYRAGFLLGKVKFV